MSNKHTYEVKLLPSMFANLVVRGAIESYSRGDLGKEALQELAKFLSFMGGYKQGEKHI